MGIVRRAGFNVGRISAASQWTGTTAETANETPANIAATSELEDDASYMIEAVFSGSDGAGLSVAYKRSAAVYRTGGGVAQLGAFSPVAEVDIDGGGATDATIWVSGADNKAYMRVTGLPATTIKWQVAFRTLRNS